MKAMIWTAYGPPNVLQLRDIDKPTPKDDQVLIKVHATTATSGDCEQRCLKLPITYKIPMRAYIGLSKPMRITILGMELAGVVEAVGKDVTRFKAGDAVFVATGFEHMGTYTEYVCMPENPDDGAIAIKPANMSFEEAAPVAVGGLEALNYLRQGGAQRGDHILINGAGGTIGAYAIQLARHFGVEVTAVDSTDKLAMLREVGADHVIDYTQEDFTQHGEHYDLIIDLPNKAPFSGCMQSLKKNGRYLIANTRPGQWFRAQIVNMTHRKKVIFGAAFFKTGDLIYLRDLIEAGTLKTVIDRCYPLEQAVEAHWYIESGQKTGNVILRVTNDT